MRYLKLFILYFRLSLLGELEYRANFWIQILESGISLVVALGGLAIVFAHTEMLGAWSADQLLALTGIHLLLGGLLGFVVSPSLNRFVQDVRSGSFDFVLIKPVSAQYIVTIQQIEIWKMINVTLGLGVIVAAFVRLGGQITWQNGVLFLVMLCLAILIIYSFFMLLATTAFWIIRAENIFQIFHSVFVAGRWPVGIYPSAMRVILTFIVPVAFAVTIPAQALIGRITTQTTLLTLFVATSLFILSRWFWQFGIRSYAGASA